MNSNLGRLRNIRSSWTQWELKLLKFRVRKLYRLSFFLIVRTNIDKAIHNEIHNHVCRLWLAALGYSIDQNDVILCGMCKLIVYLCPFVFLSCVMPGQHCVVCGSSKQKDPDCSFHKFTSILSVESVHIKTTPMVLSNPIHFAKNFTKHSSFPSILKDW